MSKIMRCPAGGYGGELPDDTPSGSVNWDNSGGTWTNQCNCICEGCCCDPEQFQWQVGGHGYDLLFSYDADGRGDNAMLECLGFAGIITDAYVYFDDCPEFTDGSDADLHFNYYTDGFPEPPYVIPNAADYDCVTVILTDSDQNVLNRCTGKLVKNDPDCGHDLSPCCDLISSDGTGNPSPTDIEIDFTSTFTDCLDPTVDFADVYFDVYYGGCYDSVPPGSYYGSFSAVDDLPVMLEDAQLEDCVCITFYVLTPSFRVIGYCAFDGTFLF